MDVPEYLLNLAAVQNHRGLSGQSTHLREIARRYKAMQDAIEDCLTTATADWDNVARHPASRFRKDVEYYTTLLAMAQAPIDKETT